MNKGIFATWSTGDLKDSCPKCSAISASKEHIENCKSTVISDAAKSFADRIDGYIYKKTMKELAKKGYKVEPDE